MRSGGCTIAERSAKAMSFPPAAVPPGYHVVYDLYEMAPLASPEALSESSSLASGGSNSLLYQRVVSCGLAFRLDPIIQSPSRSANSRDCCLFLEASDIVGDLSVLSPSVELLPLPLDPERVSIDAGDKTANYLDNTDEPPCSIDIESNETIVSSSNGLTTNLSSHELQLILGDDIPSEIPLDNTSQPVQDVVDSASVSVEPVPLSFYPEGFRLVGQHSFEISSCSNVSLACSNESPVCVTSRSCSSLEQVECGSIDEYPFIAENEQFKVTDVTSVQTAELVTVEEDSKECLENGQDHSSEFSDDECLQVNSCGDLDTEVITSIHSPTDWCYSKDSGSG